MSCPLDALLRAAEEELVSLEQGKAFEESSVESEASEPKHKPRSKRKRKRGSREDQDDSDDDEPDFQPRRKVIQRPMLLPFQPQFQPPPPQVSRRGRPARGRRSTRSREVLPGTTLPRQSDDKQCRYCKRYFSKFGCGRHMKFCVRKFGGKAIDEAQTKASVKVEAELKVTAAMTATSNPTSKASMNGIVSVTLPVPIPGGLMQPSTTASASSTPFLGAMKTLEPNSFAATVSSLVSGSNAAVGKLRFIPFATGGSGAKVAASKTGSVELASGGLPAAMPTFNPLIYGNSHKEQSMSMAMALAQNQRFKQAFEYKAKQKAAATKALRELNPGAFGFVSGQSPPPPRTPKDFVATFIKLHPGTREKAFGMKAAKKSATVRGLKFGGMAPFLDPSAQSAVDANVDAGLRMIYGQDFGKNVKFRGGFGVQKGLEQQSFPKTKFADFQASAKKQVEAGAQKQSTTGSSEEEDEDSSEDETEEEDEDSSEEETATTVASANARQLSAFAAGMVDMDKVTGNETKEGAEDVECVENITRADGTQALRCRFCKVSFAKRSQMMLHLRKHASELPFHCKLCGYCCRTERYLVRHCQVIHPRVFEAERHSAEVMKREGELWAATRRQAEHVAAGGGKVVAMPPLVPGTPKFKTEAGLKQEVVGVRKSPSPGSQSPVIVVRRGSEEAPEKGCATLPRCHNCGGDLNGLHKDLIKITLDTNRPIACPKCARYLSRTGHLPKQPKDYSVL